jgi:secreted trypsin-like serine protease
LEILIQLGDSGGPLVVFENDGSDPSTHVLLGLTSWGYGCAKPSEINFY